MLNLTKNQLFCSFFLGISFLLSLASVCSSTQLNNNEEVAPVSVALANEQTSFNLPLPTSATLGEELTLWSTYYLIYQATVTKGEDTYPLLDSNYQSLGIELSHQDWCYSALQGTVRILDENKNYRTYNYDDRGEIEQVDCSQYFSSLSEATLKKMSRNLFRPVDSPYGDGTDGFILRPYRSIAVDPHLIPLGTVIYIPSARGVKITLTSGETVEHDGYFFAADIGSAIQGHHIDTFLGVNKQNPFPYVLSRETGTFQAFIVSDPEIKSILTHVHLP
jgi:3D (Asp-Asp-Asp) domain-containing protein